MEKRRFEIFTKYILRINRSIRKIKSEEMEEFNLKSVHVYCLYYLYSEGSLTAKQLCDLCDEDKASLSRSIDFLESNGYLTCNSKTEKRYNSALQLTPKGVEVGEKVSQKIENVLSSVGIGDDEIAKFYENLIKISDNLQKYCDKYGDRK